MTERKTVTRGAMTIGYIECAPMEAVTQADKWFGFYIHGLQKSVLFDTQEEAAQWVYKRDDEHIEYVTHKLERVICELH